jgi:hypothetical protein
VIRQCLPIRAGANTARGQFERLVTPSRTGAASRTGNGYLMAIIIELVGIAVQIAAKEIVGAIAVRARAFALERWPWVVVSNANGAMRARTSPWRHGSAFVMA